MEDVRGGHIQEKSTEPEMAAAGSASDKLPAAETVVSVDDAPTKESLPGYNEKDSTHSCPLEPFPSSPRVQETETDQHQPLPWIDKRYLPWANKQPPHHLLPEDIRPLESYANGYPHLAACCGCDANFSICRKFGWLHNRVLLHLQAELGRLEDELQKLDDEQAAKTKFRERRGVFCDDADKSKRKEMLAEIRMKLAEYDDLVFRLRQKNAMKRPTREYQSSVWLFACRNVVASELEWVYRTDDLVALADDAAAQNWFNFIMRHARDLTPRLITAIFRSREQRTKTGSYHQLYLYSPIRLDAFYRGILTVMGTTMVLGPISVPSLLSRSPILTIYAFTIGFSIFCGVLTKASRDQVFAATGGYCALQVIVMLLASRMK